MHNISYDEEERGWPCPDCFYVSKYQKHDVEDHVRNWHSSCPDNWPCVSCDLVFVTKWHLKTHFQVEHEPNQSQHKCGVCKKTFKSKKALVYHDTARIDTGKCPLDSKAARKSRRPLGDGFVHAVAPEQRPDFALNPADINAIEEVHLAHENVKVVDGLDISKEGTGAGEAEVDDLLAIEEQIDVDVRSLETCAYSANTFADILCKIQQMVDDLSLRKYSNFQKRVTKLDKEVEKRLASRLRAAMQAWTQALEGRKEADVDDTMDTGGASAPAVKPDGQPQIPTMIHEIRITNQTMCLHPPLPEARTKIYELMFAWRAIVTSLTRIQSPRDQVAIDRPTSQTYRDLLTKIPDGPEVLAAAYTAIEGRMKEVEVYVDEWLNLQSEKLYVTLKEDISLWIRFLNDIKKSRTIFDTTETRKEFGAVVIDYGRVQSEVTLKYDSWHQKILREFGAMLGNEMAQFRTHVRESRSEIELLESFEAGSTADAVRLIAYVRESLKGKMKAWEKQVDTYKEGHRILEGQRFQFPTQWLHIGDIEGEWGAFSEIIKRKDNAIKSLKEKIVAEDKAVGKAKEALELEEESFTDQLPRGRLVSAYTSSPINQSQDFQDFDDVSDLTSFIQTCDSALGTLQLTKSNLDGRAQLTCIEEKAERVGHEQCTWQEEREKLKASAEKYHTHNIELETRVALLEESNKELQAALHELGDKNQGLQMENAKWQGRRWLDDSEVADCLICQISFNLTVRKHHCRNCGQIFCNECSSKCIAVGNGRKPVRVCDACFKELTINSPR